MNGEGIIGPGIKAATMLAQAVECLKVQPGAPSRHLQT